jgi:hypothetical protein
LVGESTSDSLEQDESKIKLCDCWPEHQPRHGEALHARVSVWDS